MKFAWKVYFYIGDYEQVVSYWESEDNADQEVDRLETLYPHRTYYSAMIKIMIAV